MKLNNEMYDMALKNKEICTVYNEEYVLLKKAMPVTDDKLSWYIETINRLKESGINVAEIIDYRLIPRTTNSYKDGKIQYTTGVFLEERAKGNSLDSGSVYLRVRQDYDFNEVVSRYLQLTINYIEELELRANASQEMYDKLVMDCLDIQKSGLTIDPKPLNFFFDKDCGYTVIDVIPNNPRFMDSFYLNFPQYLLGIVFGYGRPVISIDCEDCSVLSQELQERINKAGRTLEAKIVSSLRKYGFYEDNIIEAVVGNKFRYENKYDTVEIEAMEDYIAQIYMALKEEYAKKKPSESGGFSIIC